MTTQISQQEISKTAVRLGIPDHPFTHRRIARAYNLVETNKVNEVSREDGFYRVHSQYNDKIYTIELNHGNPHCTCPDGERTIFCKHSIASMMVGQEHKAKSLIVKETPHNEKVKASWVVTDGNEYTTVWQDLNGKICCVCGAYYNKDCIHKQLIRDYYDGGNGWRVRSHALGSKIVNDCGTSEAKALQKKMNGDNGTGDNQSPVHHQLDTSDPFQECEQRDIDQINGNGNGDLVHHLSNGEYIISYNGIMALSEVHGVTFTKHTDEQEAKDTRTVIAHARRGNNTRASGKPMNGSFITAVELAKRNAARQLLPLVEIKALEKKAQLESEFDWQVAKRKCLEIVPDFTFEIIIHDLVKADTLRQAHPSDYNRKEWLVIFDAVKKDAEINGNDNDGGDDTPSSYEQVTCCICGRTLTNKLSISRCVGPECFKKVGAQGAQFLQDDEVSDELIKASKLYQDEALQKRIVKSCLTLDAPLPVKVLRWLGNEYFGYKNRPILYYVCADGQLNRIDTAKRKLRHAIITRDTAETELDAHALSRAIARDKQMAADVADPSERKAEVPDNVDEFVARCKEMESEVDDPAPMVEVSQMNGDGKRKLVMDKNKNITLVEPDGTETPITMRDAAFDFGSNFILRLTQGIACGGDISTVELDN